MAPPKRLRRPRQGGNASGPAKPVPRRLLGGGGACRRSCTLALGRRWIAAQRPGVVLSILSTSSRTGRAFTVPSAVGKAGLLAMTRSLAVEWGPQGIRLVAIAPGPFPTEGSNRQLNPGVRSGSAARAPLNPTGPQAADINGEMVAIDGGAHLRTSGAEDLLHWSPAQWQALRPR